MSAEQHQPRKSFAERVIEWAQGLPLWQSDAVRRLLQQVQLTDADKRQVLLLLKADYGLLPSGASVPAGIRPRPGDLSGTSDSREKVTLCAINNLQNVNAIANGSSLPVGDTGLTVVYGENGSGKSGYARVLKLACRARGSEGMEILPNVFASATSVPSHASADFVVRIDGAESKSVSWESGTTEPRELACVAFFDSDCARYTLDRNNRPLYSPYGAFAFSGLALLMRDMRVLLEAEKPPLVPPDGSGLESGTTASQFVTNLSAATTPQAILEACAWSDADSGALVNLEKDVARLETEDPQALAAKADAIKTRVDALADALRKAEAVFSDAALADLAAKRDRVAAGEKALQILRDSTAQEPLVGVGSDEWRMLYDAAKEYSTKHAYPSMEFPHVGPDSRCVFCQQELLEDGKARLTRFRDFMESKVTSELREAKLALQGAEKSRREYTPPGPEAFEDVVLDLTSRAPAVAAAVAAYLKAVQGRPVTTTEPVGALPKCPLAELVRVSTELGKTATEYRMRPKSDLVAQARGRLAELRSRKALAALKDYVERYVTALQTRARIDECLRALNTRAVTEKQEVLIGDVLAQGLQEALSAELQNLGAPQFLTPKGTPRGGDTLLGLKLQSDGRELDVEPSAVLSEGEQRVVAIAGFLAELAASGHDGPIAFDDPVCSLDHLYKDKITQRIVKEAARRQVLVFTHDIEFLLEAIRHAQEKKVAMLIQSVRSEGQEVGLRCEGLPWHASFVKARTGLLKNDLVRIRSLYQNDRTAYNKEAAGLYNRLRMTWERLVEERLFREVIRRYSPAVQTKRLSEVSVGDDDYRIVDSAMTECSKWAHDAPTSVNPNLPDPDTIAQAIGSLEGYADQLDIRAKGTRKQRTAGDVQV